MDNEFNNFIERFLQWSIDTVEKTQEHGMPLCVYAKKTRLSNLYQFIDAREDMISQIETFDNSKDIGVAWLGDVIDIERVNANLAVLRNRNLDLTIMLSTPNTGFITSSFTHSVVIHNKIDFNKKRLHLYDIGYYSIYPTHFQNIIRDICKNEQSDE